MLDSCLQEHIVNFPANHVLYKLLAKMFISRESRFSLVLLEFNEVRKKIETMYELPSGKFAYQFSQHNERSLLIWEFIQKK